MLFRSFLAVPVLFLALPGPFLAAPVFFVAVPVLFVAVRALPVAVPGLCAGLSNAQLGIEDMGNPQLQLHSNSCFHALDLLDLILSVLLLKWPKKTVLQRLHSTPGPTIGLLADLALEPAL